MIPRINGANFCLISPQLFKFQKGVTLPPPKVFSSFYFSALAASLSNIIAPCLYNIRDDLAYNIPTIYKIGKKIRERISIIEDGGE